MTDYGTIKIPRDDYARHNDRRQDLGLSWAEYIDGEAPDVRNSAEVNPDEIAKRVVEHTDIDSAADAEELAAEVARQFDYAAVADKTAEEVIKGLRQ
jgi:hypothetical protein